MSTPSALLQVMIDAVRKAARPLARDFGEVQELQVSRKGPGDFVTAADLKTEAALFESLLKARPGYGFLGEERGLVEGTDKTHTWIVDPIDGTTNFVHGMPHFAVTVALERREADGRTEIVAGVTFNPILNELFWAERGKGAFLNDKRIRVAGRNRLDDALIGTGVPFVGRPGHGQFLKELHQLTQRVAGVRRLGSSALDFAWVAAGRYDAYWERNLKPWDVAAGILLVTEAGGKVTTIDEDGDPKSGVSICAANLDLHPQLIEKLRAA
ncbi:inositol monophosphatase family protein [Caulobacter sp. 17J80-11]|uniref:inositol monophosphatase family protein n=1 Tax=Caulobacter sp. 17J80-11 TaxID=2763502 RepID=UPI0016539047|nr:inositol monophosphatase [Caulobacter sp. 17J80-11]